jgi:hypothetical protein
MEWSVMLITTLRETFISMTFFHIFHMFLIMQEREREREREREGERESPGLQLLSAMLLVRYRCGGY